MGIQDFELDEEFAVIISLGVIVTILMFFGAIKAFKATVNNPRKGVNIEAEQKQSEQQQMIKDTERRRKQLMEENRQKLRDFQRR